MGKKSSQTVTKLKQVATDKKQMNVRKWADKTKILKKIQLAKHTQVNKVFKLVSRLSKAISDIP